MYIAIDIGGTNARISGSEKLGDVKFGKIIKFELSHDFKKDYGKINESIRNISNSKIDAIGIGTPGTYSEDKKNLISAKNLFEWVEKPFVDYFSKEFGCSVFADNDAVVASFGEYYYGKNKKKDFLYLTWGTGIGGSNLKSNTGKLISEKIDWDLYLREFNIQCGGYGIEKRFNKSAKNLSNDEWDLIMNDFVLYISDISEKLGQSEIVLGGGATVKQKERLKEVIEKLAKKEINLHLSRLNDEVGLFGAVALIARNLNSKQ